MNFVKDPQGYVDNNWLPNALATTFSPAYRDEMSAKKAIESGKLVESMMRMELLRNSMGQYQISELINSGVIQEGKLGPGGKKGIKVDAEALANLSGFKQLAEIKNEPNAKTLFLQIGNALAKTLIEL